MYQRLRIISLDIHNVSFKESLDQISEWGLNNLSKFVCFANVHMIIEAHTKPSFQKALNQASLILADGKPVANACGWLYGNKQQRISGMDFMPALLERANILRAKIFLYGSTENVLEKLSERIAVLYPNVIIAGEISPPFRSLSKEERDIHIDHINASGANFVLVALGCPKQEKWMAENSPYINGTLLGLGGAFLVVAGLQKRSPKWMQDFSLEWFYRFLQEPRRMFRRYMYTNLYFIWLLAKELIKKKIKN
jgi:N-acetylglucosaminyldiphosphoundecaprenol N-acetyl-beta-D-mannosaminyltransferase